MSDAVARAEAEQDYIREAHDLRETDWEFFEGAPFLVPDESIAVKKSVNAHLRPAVDTFANALQLLEGSALVSGRTQGCIENARQAFGTCKARAELIGKEVHGKPTEQRQQFVRETGETYSAGAASIVVNCHYALAELSIKRTWTLEKERSEFTALTSSAQGTLAETRQALHQAREALAAAQGTATQEGFNRQAAAYARARLRHRWDARLWLAASTAMAGALLLGCWYEMKMAKPEDGALDWLTVGALSHLGPRVFLLSVLSFILVACVRNYRAARHNEVVNGFRADAVATFHAFRNSGNGQVEAALTALAGQAVFAPQSSGYGDSGPLMSSHLAELVAAIKGSETTADKD